MLLWSTLLLCACTLTPQSPAMPGYSNLPPRELLAAWLDQERQPGTLRFRFNSEVEVEGGKVQTLQGVCGLQRCGALRMQLLGPLGVTLLDYVNAAGKSELPIDKLTDDGDDAARAGLLQLLDALTLALTERCQSADEFELERYDGGAADFSVRARGGATLGFTLDRRWDRLTRQTVVGDALPGFTVEYSDYRVADGRWMPGRLEIRTEHMPTAISLTVDRWVLGKPFPAGFFDAH